MFGLNDLAVNRDRLSAAVSPRLLFRNNEQGLWYDLNDDATIFQDSAGTTLATWGDPVGLTLDKSRWDGRGVVNLVINSGDVSAASWLTLSAFISRPSSSVIVETADNQTHYLGGPSLSYVSGRSYTTSMTLEKGVLATAPDIMQISLPLAPFGAGQWANVNVLTGAVVSATGCTCTSIADPLGGWRFSYTATATATASGISALLIFCNNNGAASRLPSYVGSTTSDCKVYRIQTELGSTATAYQANGASVGGAGNHAIQATAGSRPIRGRVPKRGRVNELVSTATMATQNVAVTAAQRTLSFTGTGTVTLSGASTAGPLVGTGASNRVSLTFTPSAGTLTLTVTGSVTLAQLQLGAAFDNYQAVNDALGFNITESGQPSCGYLSFNGSNQWMQTAAAVNFSATDEMSVFAGVRKVSNAAAGCVAELSVDRNVNNGAFSMFAPTGALTGGAYTSRGTADSSAITTALVPPIFAALTGLSEISADTCLFRSNGVQLATSATDQGTGNYGNYVTYFGARGGTSLFFNGLMFSTIIRGALTSGTLLTRTEQYVARQTPTVNL